MQNWYDTNDNYDQYKKDYIALYVDTIMPAVAEQDTTRTYLVIAIFLSSVIIILFILFENQIDIQLLFYFTFIFLEKDI